MLTRLATNAAGIGLALLVLAWVEHNPALLVLTAGYLAVVVVPLSFGWHLAASYPGNWAFLPGLVIQGSVLLIGGLGFLLAQRAGRAGRPGRAGWPGAA